MLIAYTNALEMIRSLRPVVDKLKDIRRGCGRSARSRRDQRREQHRGGRPPSGQDRKRFYRIAQGSAGEILAVLDGVEAWGWRLDTEQARYLLDRELALLWGLCR